MSEIVRASELVAGDVILEIERRGQAFESFAVGKIKVYKVTAGTMHGRDIVYVLPDTYARMQVSPDRRVLRATTDEEREGAV